MHKIITHQAMESNQQRNTTVRNNYRIALNFGDAKLWKISLYKIGQMTKPIIVVKMPCKLLYVIQVKGFLINFQLIGLT